jgi:hypothetical protein
MIKLSDLTKDYKTGTQKSRKELVKMFVERLNNDRKFAKLKEIRPAFYAIAMSKIPTYDLQKYFNELDRTGNFSKAWWSKLK